MLHAAQKRRARIRRHQRVRRRVVGDAVRPRLAVYRSNRHIYVQLIDDAAGRTLASASSREADSEGAGDKRAAARRVGGLIGRRAREAGIDRAVFDRGGRLYHGRVREIAEGAREEGLEL